MANVLVVANQTIGGSALLEKVGERQARGDVKFFLVVPRSRPRRGAIIYEDTVYDAAQVRIDLAKAVMAENGIEIEGQVGDPDAFAAITDAVDEFAIDEIILSTLPYASSGWLGRDLIERVEQTTGLPVEHVVTDIDSDGLPFKVTLVVANQTVNADDLLRRLKEKAGEGDGERRVFLLVVPQGREHGNPAFDARQRLNRTLATLRGERLLCAGMTGVPDPYDATMNALQVFHVDDIVISTLAETRSGWQRANLVERVQGAVACPVEHIVAREPATAGATS